MTESTSSSTSTASTAGTPASDDPLADLPPSAKLVHLVLDRDGARTQTELAEETSLSARTVRTALNRLEDVGIVTESICLRDARKRIYSLESDSGAGTDIEADA